MSDLRTSIVLLVGPKGAGKTTIGALLARELQVAFLRVEPIYLRTIHAHPDLPQTELEPLGFGAILAAVDDLARTSRVVCFESTGTAGYFPEFLRRLRARYRVYLIRVFAPLEECRWRVLHRDATNHIPVSDDRLQEINRRAAGVMLAWDLEIDNSGTDNERAIVDAVAGLVCGA
jgi:cytidylate kinase